MIIGYRRFQIFVLIILSYPLYGMEEQQCLPAHLPVDKTYIASVHDFYVACEALTSSDTKKARNLVETNRAILLLCDSDKKTLLHRAIEAHRPIFALWLILEQGHVSDAQNAHYQTPLQAALCSSETDVALALISKGCKLDVHGDHAPAALFLALGKANARVARVLIENAASLSLTDTEGNTPLHLAVALTEASLVKRMIELGASLTALNNAGKCPLDCAIISGSDSILKVMMEAVVTAGLLNKHGNVLGRRALSVAIKRNKTAIIEELLSTDPELVNSASDSGRMPLHHAAKQNKAMVALLLRYGAKIEALTKEGKSVLLYAIEKGKNDVAEFLIDSGVQRDVMPDFNLLEAQDNEGNGPLHKAAVSGNSNLLKLLLAHGCSLRCSDALGNTPLHAAAASGQEEAVKLLLAAGARVEGYNALGLSPLHCAASVGNAPICKALICRPDIITKMLEVDVICKRMITICCCIKRCMNQLGPHMQLPRELLFKIFMFDEDLYNDFALMLFLQTYNPKRRQPTTSITNTSAWRLLIHYNQEKSIGEIIVDPGAKVVLDIRPDQISHLTGELYGEKWSKLEWAPLDLYKGLQEQVTQKPEHDVDVVIDGGQGMVRQFTRPFKVRCLSYKVAEYEPVSLVPQSRLLLDAFPCVRYKVARNEPIEARYFLQLPAYCSRDALTAAYTRLSFAWDNERKINAGNEAYVTRVLEIVKAAYDHYTQQTPFPKFKLNETVPLIEIEEPKDSRVWFIKSFFNRQALTPDAARRFFAQFCIEQQQRYMAKCDGEGRTAYEVALENNHDAVAQLLHVNHRGESCELLRQQLHYCFSLNQRFKIEHVPDKLLTRIVLERMGILGDTQHGLGIAKAAGATVLRAGQIAVCGVLLAGCGVVIIGTTPITVPLFVYFIMSGSFFIG